MQFSTQAPQYTHKSSVIPTLPVPQYKAFVGQALMHSLHCPPTHVNSLILILPSLKSSLTPVGSISSLRRCRFSVSSSTCALFSSSISSYVEGGLDGILGITVRLGLL